MIIKPPTASLSALLLAVSFASTASGETLQRFEFTRVEMAVPFRIVLYAPHEAAARAASEEAFERIAELNDVLSDYLPTSELRRLCATAGEGRAVPVSDDLWRVLASAQHYAQLSDGAFDVTVGPVVRLWRRARRIRELPDPDLLAAAQRAVGYHLMRLDSVTRSVELTAPEMLIDLGAIGKGYAVDEALEVLAAHGITRAMVDGGGDLAVGDPPPSAEGWLIAVAPLEADQPPEMYLYLSHAAIATSGDAWQAVEIDGVRYSHLVDPRTAMAMTEPTSVTVVAADCLSADALASAVSILGPEEGLRIVDEEETAAALVARQRGDHLVQEASARWDALRVLSRDEVAALRRRSAAEE